MLDDDTLLRTGCLIDGEWIAEAGGNRLTVSNPADGAVITSVPDMGPGETRAAIADSDARRLQGAAHRLKGLAAGFDAHEAAAAAGSATRSARPRASRRACRAWSRRCRPSARSARTSTRTSMPW